MRKSKRWLSAALVLGVMACVGIGIAVVGSVLSMKLCLGGGSECDRVAPVWSTGGNILQTVGGIIFLGTPVAAGLVAWRMQDRPGKDGTNA